MEFDARIIDRVNYAVMLRARLLIPRVLTILDLQHRYPYERNYINRLFLIILCQTSYITAYMTELSKAYQIPRASCYDKKTNRSVTNDYMRVIAKGPYYRLTLLKGILTLN